MSKENICIIRYYAIGNPLTRRCAVYAVWLHIIICILRPRAFHWFVSRSFTRWNHNNVYTVIYKFWKTRRWNWNGQLYGNYSEFLQQNATCRPFDLHVRIINNLNKIRNSRKYNNYMKIISFQNTPTRKRIRLSKTFCLKSIAKICIYTIDTAPQQWTTFNGEKQSHANYRHTNWLVITVLKLYSEVYSLYEILHLMP